MSNDMFPQGFIDMVESAEYWIEGSSGEREGPFVSDIDALGACQAKPIPRHWTVWRVCQSAWQFRMKKFKGEI